MLSKVSRLLLIVVFSLGLVLPVLADDTTTTGSVSASNAAPTITSVTLQAADKLAEAISMDPLTEYVVQIVAGDANTIDDIKQIDIVLFYDGDGGQNGDGAAALVAGFDADEIAVYKWVKTASAWSLEKGNVTTTWTLGAGNDTPGNMTLTEGEWNLSFTPGKLAVAATAGGGLGAEWDIYVKVTDVSDATAATTVTTKAMTAYSAITMSDAAFNFGDLSLGGTAAIQTPLNHIITTRVIANAAHALKVSTDATWTTGTKTIALNVSGTPNAAGQFGLVIDDAADVDGHPTTGQAVTNLAATITGHDADGRTSTISTFSEGTSDTDVYMDLTLDESGIDNGTYEGAFTFQVTTG